MIAEDKKVEKTEGAGATGPGSRHLTATDAGWETCRILVPIDEISYVVSIFEGYDNEFLIRTETRGLGLLRIWYAVTSRATMNEVLKEMRGEFPVQVLGFSAGMDGLEEIYPERDGASAAN
ncbi:hypothetical protein BH09SUM1_BH09SUM1_22410 [soil metagenome]